MFRDGKKGHEQKTPSISRTLKDRAIATSLQYPGSSPHIATVPHSRLLVTQGETTIFSFSRHQRIAHAKPSSPEASTCCKATGTDVDLVWHSVEQDIAETRRSEIGRGTEVQGTWEAHKCIVRVLRRGGIDYSSPCSHLPHLRGHTPL